MDDKRLVKASKYLSRHLRHQPEVIGLMLEPGGWVAVDALLAAAKRHGVAISRVELEEIVARNNKQRFAFDETGQRIRASQGHSVPIDLQLAPIAPPDVLYHGTGKAAVGAILREGLCKMRRHHVHLSSDSATAIKVGSRHGAPVVLLVDAAAITASGSPRRFPHAIYASFQAWSGTTAPPPDLGNSVGRAVWATRDTTDGAHVAYEYLPTFITTRGVRCPGWK